MDYFKEDHRDAGERIEKELGLLMVALRTSK